MTKLSLSIRIEVASRVFKIHAFRTRCWGLAVRLLQAAVWPHIRLHERRIQRVERWKSAARSFGERAAAIVPELKSLNNLSADRKSEVLTLKKALLKESDQLRSYAAELNAPRPIATALLLPLGHVTNHMQQKIARIQAKTHSFRTVISHIN